MVNAISINIGLNEIDFDWYGTRGRLDGCENDAKFMNSLAKEMGFEKCELLLTSDANFENVETAIKNASQILDTNGILLISFAGHGGKTKDITKNEVDGYDETWCLYDDEILDDEIYKLLTLFKENQRILVISDSCHSGTITGSISSDFSNFIKKEKFILREFINKCKENNIDLAMFFEQDNFRFLPVELLELVYTMHKPHYDDKQKKTQKALENINPNGKDFRELLKASVLLISACQDWQLAKDTKENGIFTKALKEVLNGEKIIEIENNETIKVINETNRINYIQLHEKIWEKLKDTKQNPNYYKIGPPNSKFELQSCFKI